MQCGCPHCGTLTAQAQRGMQSACVCPACGWICRDCMGEGRGRFALLTPEDIKKMKQSQSQIGDDAKSRDSGKDQAKDKDKDPWPIM